MLGLGLSLQKGISAFNAGRALVSSYIRRVTEAGGVLQNTACDAAAINELNQDRLLEPASWVLVPDGIKEDVVFAQKPTSGLGDLTFTRASDATYTDSTGVVRRSPYNLLQFSEMFSDGVYTKVATTITANTIVAPNGTLTADKLVSTSASSSHSVYQNLGNIGDVRTISCFVKKAEYRYVNLQYGTAVTRFDFDTLTFSGGTGNSYIDAGDGWYRISSILTATVNARASIAIPDNSGNVSYVGDNVSGTFIWGFQAVEGTSALDYFPTTNRQDVPRIDFRNADGTLSSCGRLLLEPQRTNVCLWSEQIDNAGWTKTNAPTITTNTATAPDGYVGADGIQDTTAGVFKRIRQLFSVTANSTNTASVFVKKETVQTNFGGLALTYTGSTTKYAYGIINPIAGTIVVSSDSLIGATSTKVEDYGNWWRFSLTATDNGSNTTLEIAYYATISTNGTSAGVGTGSVRTVWGFQVEIGATYATSYIPTLGAAVTRLADAASKTGVSSLIGQTEGTLFVDFVYSAKTGNNRFSISSGSTANWIFIGTPEDASTNKSRFYIRTNNTIQVDVGTTAYFTFGQRYKLALAYKSGSWAVYGNGTLLYSGTHSISAVSSPLSVLNFFQETGQVCDAVELMNQAALFPTRLSNDQLEVLTSEGYGTYALLAQSLNCVLQ